MRALRSVQVIISSHRTCKLVVADSGLLRFSVCLCGGKALINHPVAVHPHRAAVSLRQCWIKIHVDMLMNEFLH